MNKESQPIENREVRGLTAKTLAAIFGGFAMVLISVVGSYYSIMRRLDVMETLKSDINLLQKRTDDNSNDIRTIDIRVTRIEEQLKDKIK